MLASHNTNEYWQRDVFLGRQQETIAGAMSGYGFTVAGTSYDFEDRLTGYQQASRSYNQSWNLTAIGLKGVELMALRLHPIPRVANRHSRFRYRAKNYSTNFRRVIKRQMGRGPDANAGDCTDHWGHVIVPGRGFKTTQNPCRHPSVDDCRLIMEVADSSLQKDRAKAAIYFSTGVEEYWIVNLEEKRQECYLSKTPGVPEVFDRNDTIRTTIGVKTIELALCELT